MEETFGPAVLLELLEIGISKLIDAQKLDLHLQTLELSGERLPNPLHISLPLMGLAHSLSIRERLAEIPRNLKDTH